jgi:hypothetical protein
MAADKDNHEEMQWEIEPQSGGHQLGVDRDVV